MLVDKHTAVPSLQKSPCLSGVPLALPKAVQIHWIPSLACCLLTCFENAIVTMQGWPGWHLALQGFCDNNNCYELVCHSQQISPPERKEKKKQKRPPDKRLHNAHSLVSLSNVLFPFFSFLFSDAASIWCRWPFLHTASSRPRQLYLQSTWTVHIHQEAGQVDPGYPSHAVEKFPTKVQTHLGPSPYRTRTWTLQPPCCPLESSRRRVPGCPAGFPFGATQRPAAGMHSFFRVDGPRARCLHGGSG
ncbi:hypothetical protein J3F84DRAFT_80600 [Trichoderma pleuroticola]